MSYSYKIFFISPSIPSLPLYFSSPRRVIFQLYLHLHKMNLNQTTLNIFYGPFLSHIYHKSSISKLKLFERIVRFFQKRKSEFLIFYVLLFSVNQCKSFPMGPNSTAFSSKGSVAKGFIFHGSKALANQSMINW